MPYYLAPLVKAARGFEPQGADSQAERNWILLHDKAILWTRDPVPGITKLAEDAEEIISAATILGLSNLRGDGKIPEIKSIADSIADLLTDPPPRWKGLRPSKKNSRFEVWLGPNGLLWSRPVESRKNSQTFNDTFNRANANLGGSTSSDGLFTWLEVDGTAWTIVSNTARCDGNVNFNTARANADLDTDDHYSQALISTFTRDTGTFLTPGVLVRWTGATSGYGFEVGIYGGNNSVRRTYQYNDDANIASDTTTTTSGTIRIEADGSSVTGKVNGVTALGPSTDTTHTGQLRTGISNYSTGTGNVMAFDDFQAGDLVAGVAIDAERRFFSSLFISMFDRVN